MDLTASAIEVYASPVPGGRYAEKRAFAREEELRSSTVAGLRVAVRDVESVESSPGDAGQQLAKRVNPLCKLSAFQHFSLFLADLLTR